MKTTDGGASWNSLPIPNAPILHDVATIDQHTAVVVGLGGMILRTTDAGSSWASVPSGTHDELFGVSFVDQNIGTVVGYFGTILRTTSGGIEWVSEELVGSVCIEPTLSQNYPNPFNSATTIQYGVSNTSFVGLTVFDLLGRGVATLVNDFNLPGDHKVVLNGNNLASGMYLYRLQVGDYTKTKKLILLK